MLSNVESNSHLLKMKLELRSMSYQTWFFPPELCYISRIGMHVCISDVDEYVLHLPMFCYCNGQQSLKTGTVHVCISAPVGPQLEMNYT